MDGLSFHAMGFAVTKVMDVVAPIYRLESERDTRGIRGGDWDMNEEKGLVFYKPANLLFAILMDDAQTSAPVPLMALAAKPIHFCDGAVQVTSEAMKQIAKDAIHMFYLFADICSAADHAAEPVGPNPSWDFSPDDDLPF